MAGATESTCWSESSGCAFQAEQSLGLTSWLGMPRFCVELKGRVTDTDIRICGLTPPRGWQPVPFPPAAPAPEPLPGRVSASPLLYPLPPAGRVEQRDHPDLALACAPGKKLEISRKDGRVLPGANEAAGSTPLWAVWSQPLRAFLICYGPGSCT